MKLDIEAMKKNKAWVDYGARLEAEHEAYRAQLEICLEVFRSQADPEHAMHGKRINWADLRDTTKRLLGEP